MSKKKNSKKTPKSSVAATNQLPQNIIMIGEMVEENKNIYISQPVYRAIHKFTKNKTVNESGGMLIGETIESFGKTNIIINGFIEAKFCEATSTTLKFTHETWEYTHKEMNKKFPKQKIVGWIHTHPNFGIFLSEYDKFIHENFFGDEQQIAYVVDPIQNIEGFYFWINGKIERCKGFYKFDKTGVKLESAPATKNTDKIKNNSYFSIKNAIIFALAICSLFLALTNRQQSKEISELQNQQKNTTQALQQQIAFLNNEINTLKNQLNNYSDELIVDTPSNNPIIEETQEEQEIPANEETVPDTNTEDSTSSTNTTIGEN